MKNRLLHKSPLDNNCSSDSVCNHDCCNSNYCCSCVVDNTPVSNDVVALNSNSHFDDDFGRHDVYAFDVGDG